MKSERRIAMLLLGAGVSWSSHAQDASDLDCVIEPSEVAEVSTSVRGIVATLEVERGDFVEEGQVVATLERSVEDTTVKLAEARADSTAEVRAREARVEFAQKQVDRIRNLRETQAISAQSLDEAETDLEVARIALDQALEAQRIAAIELERAQRVLDLRIIRSPVTGVVVRIYTSASESVEDRPIMDIARIDPLFVEAIVPVELFGLIREGMNATVRPEEPVGGAYQASVALVERVLDASSGTFAVRLSLPNPDGNLPAGLRCKLEVRF